MQVTDIKASIDIAELHSCCLTEGSERSLDIGIHCKFLHIVIGPLNSPLACRQEV
jgi:hypothetical protein